MSHLEKLTLHLRMRDRSTLIDGTHLHNEILVHMPQLHTFIFHISTMYNINESVHSLSNDDIQQTFPNIKYGQTACIIDYFTNSTAICHVFSLPFTFTRLEQITSRFPSIVFDTVTHLNVYDIVPLKHEFFMRISRNFPLLKCFSMTNYMSQSSIYEGLGDIWESDENPSNSVIEYPHLISLDITDVHMDYIAQFLLETKTHLPCLAELKVNYKNLKTVTMNFTREAMRRNCSKVKRLIVEKYLSKNALEYFPSLLTETCVILE
jgi:hypothetical protein